MAAVDMFIAFNMPPLPLPVISRLISQGLDTACRTAKARPKKSAKKEEESIALQRLTPSGHFKQGFGSGSVFGFRIRIRIQNGINDLEK
jgi:hypothetical protein